MNKKRKKETITLSIPPGTKENLENLAVKHGIYWGKTPSPSGLITAIATGELEVGQPFSLDEERVKALRKAVKALIDQGDVVEAQSIMSLLLERGNLEVPLRQQLNEKLDQPLEAWRFRVNQLIEQKQPFHLYYINSQKQELEYTVRFAKVIFYEKRFYVQAWCEETEDSKDIEELKHNHCFRLDRIKAIYPIAGQWRDDFDYVKVYLRFCNWLIKAYESQEEDLANEVKENYRLVVRKVANSFWFFREIAKYWDDCEIVSPQNLREEFKRKLNVLRQMYDES